MFIIILNIHAYIRLFKVKSFDELKNTTIKKKKQVKTIFLVIFSSNNFFCRFKYTCTNM